MIYSIYSRVEYKMSLNLETRAAPLHVTRHRPARGIARSAAQTDLILSTAQVANLQTPCTDDSCASSMTPPPSSLSSSPPPVPVDTHPHRAQPPELDRIPDPNRLAPEDAYFAPSLSRVRSAPLNYDDSLRSLSSDRTAIASLRPPRGVLGDPNRKDVRKLRSTSGRRRRKGAWKKLLWVKQSCMPLSKLSFC